MLDQYFRHFYTMMLNLKTLTRRRRKKDMQLYYFGEDVIVMCLNDNPNKRVLAWFFYVPTKKILTRISYHGYHARQLTRKIEQQITKIKTDEDYRDTGILKRRSYSYKKDQAFKRKYNNNANFRNITDQQRNGQSN